MFLLAAFAVGVIFGFLANGTLVLRTRHRLRKAQREADRSQRQLDEKQIVPAEEVV